MVGADLRHVLLTEVQIYLAQVFVIEERTALALIENEVRILPACSSAGAIAAHQAP